MQWKITQGVAVGHVVHLTLQWGHGEGAVEDTAVLENQGVCVIALEWGHGEGAWKMTNATLELTDILGLQWGHGEDAAEASRSRRPGNCPWPSFNEATAKMPWKMPPSRSRVAGARGRFNGATARGR